MTKQEKHATEKHSEKHTAEKAAPPIVKYEKAPPKEGMVRLHMQKLTDEVNHGTTSYRVDDDGLVDVPPEAAQHVLRQGGAVQVYPVPVIDAPKPQGDLQIIHVSDSATILSYGDTVYTPDNKGIITVPLEVWPEAEAHGFAPLIT